MSYTLTFDTGGLKTALAKIEKRVGTPAPALKLIGQTILDDIVLPAFSSSTAPDGTPWEPLKESTLEGIVPGTAGRRRKTYGSKPLVRRRLLRNSMNWQLTADQRAVSIGTPFEWFKYHQQPPTNPPGKGIIPRRPALPDPTATGRLPPNVQKLVSGTLGRYIMNLDTP